VTKKWGTMMDHIWYLEKVDLFKVLSKAEISFLIEIASRKTYEKNEIIFMPGDPGNTVFLITQGRVKLYNLSPSGRESILFIFLPGEILGLSEMFGNNLRVSFAEAIEPTELLILQRIKITQLLEKNIRFARAIAQTLGTRLMQLGKRFESVSNQNLSCRIAQLLLNLSDMCGVEYGQHTLIEQKITHQDIASMIGAARQSVTEALNVLIRASAIKYDKRKRIIVINKAKLADIVDSSIE
jgi:CRP/FNR family transcriptional regulator, cyclic AMP receptor protein